MIEYETRVLTFSPEVSIAESRRILAELAEYEHWELHRLRLHWGGRRRVWLRRKIIRVRRTA